VHDLGNAGTLKCRIERNIECQISLLIGAGPERHARRGDIATSDAVGEWTLCFRVNWESLVKEQEGKKNES
jgi:hypothetical protein